MTTATNPATAELAACPFCGAAPTMKFIGNDHTKTRAVTVKCSNAECRIERTDKAFSHDHAWLANVAAEGWNRRATQASAEPVAACKWANCPHGADCVHAVPSSAPSTEPVIDSTAVFKITTESVNHGWNAGWRACANQVPPVITQRTEEIRLRHGFPAHITHKQALYDVECLLAHIAMFAAPDRAPSTEPGDAK